MSFPLRTLGLALLLPTLALAQQPTSPPAPAATSSQWYLLDPEQDKAMGISARRAYQELLAGRPSQPVLVAVIDGGIDSTHQDLKRVLWRNPREVPGNGQDDDRNGYPDDVRGWNFLGGPDGRSIDVETLEDTRLLARLQPLYAGKTRTAVPTAKRAEYDLYLKVKKSYEAKVKENTDRLKEMQQAYDDTRQGAEGLRQVLGVARLDTATLRRPPSQDPALLRATSGLYANLRQAGYGALEDVLEEIQDGIKETKNLLDYGLNPKYTPRAEVVQDRPDDVQQRTYGNPDSHGPDPGHGTHVAGIIGADRENGLGIDGVAGNVRLLAVRAVPNGDERDKDVANAIRYAVDQGAQIINMSFGKYYSPQRAAVEDAIRYAASKNVLLVHSAGNESQNLDQQVQYPASVYQNGQRIPNMITVGASARTNDENLVAEFSNYSKTQVDVFAPGSQIYSTLPQGRFGNMSGTSMAAPVVSGMAAVLKSYFPQLTAEQLKRIILASAAPTHTRVRQPGSDKLVDFADLSQTGGVVNLYRAVQLAQQESQTTGSR
ncbi:S8 family peptidase [Hymenobacter weizhouensis]|uniref:S8 family peptidase n=1 Tax=Hymenobacter sp. YIM 151500-1 TaxID=2987689 RepID=UPI002225E14A|nr:S8 family peptidase [Hymenobacter sp. YIM 151500-1]UYZ65066.1 S8 family peptidase [Hymenobacter sp. YIM 151500-1]